MTTKMVVMLREGADHNGITEKLQVAANRSGFGDGFDINPRLVGTFLMEVTGAPELMKVLGELAEVEIVAPKTPQLLRCFA